MIKWHCSLTSYLRVFVILFDTNGIVLVIVFSLHVPHVPQLGTACALRFSPFFFFLLLLQQAIMAQTNTKNTSPPIAATTTIIHGSIFLLREATAGGIAVAGAGVAKV